VSGYLGQYASSPLQLPCSAACKAAATAGCHIGGVPTDPIDRFAAAVERASMATADLFCHDAVLDATVPNWRFTVRGGSAVQARLAEWFETAGRFEQLRRVPLPDGELVEFLLTWEEHGVPYAAHQAHLLRVRDGRIAEDVAFCGGRWSAARLAEMEAAQQAADREQAHAAG
jgi:ketosteroid isomerase-like protein